MAYLTMRDQKLNQFARKIDLQDLDAYLYKVSKTPYGERDEVLIGKYVDKDVKEWMDTFVEKVDPEVNYIKDLTEFDIIEIGEGEYFLDLFYKNSYRLYAKKLFNHLASNQHSLSDLSGTRVRSRILRDEREYRYRIRVNCRVKEELNGGLFNLTLLVYTLVKLGK